ncbi:MAG: agmatinase [Candidatus Riflebacteria bacterium]|nr:agmatinase [Candidatus Riflebacteria bacterium]
MKNNHSFRGMNNFLGLPEESCTYKTSRAVILPVPYDSTTSYKAGTREGPSAIIAASRNVELYDLDLKCEPLNSGVHTLPELEPDMSGPEGTITRVEGVIRDILEDGKLPVMLGGEHSLTLGPIKAMISKYGNDFSVLQLDAHADLRDEFENTIFNHASVMRRVIEHVPLTQVGIRNISAAEMKFIKRKSHKNVFWAHEIHDSQNWVEEACYTLKQKVYITIDLDVFDPSIMPAVGTPEPGGLDWYRCLALLEKVIKEHELIGLDIVELCPIPGLIYPDFLAAKLLFKLLGRYFVEKKVHCED